MITIDGIRKDKFGCCNSINQNLTPNLTSIAKESVIMNNMMACATSAMCFSSLLLESIRSILIGKNMVIIIILF